MEENKFTFDINELPTAYFCDNIKANDLRNQLIKNHVRVAECNQNDLENIFFSDENISIINKKLILDVFKKTEGQFKIEPQSKLSLTIVMRYIFLEHALHLPNKIKEQINCLNNKVVNEVLSNVITNITQYVSYMNEINNPRTLLPLPINVNKSNLLPPINK